MYLHYILNLKEEELLVRIYRAQKEAPYKNDWCLQVKQDMVDFGIELTETEIAAKTKETFKSIVKDKCKKAAFEFLLEEQKKVNRKMGKLKYTELKMQNYLQSNIITTSQKKLLYRLRVRMVNVSNNMGQKTPCPLCTEECQTLQNLDCQEHLFDCSIIKEEVQEIQNNTIVRHDDVYSDDIMKQKAAVELFQKAIKARTIIMAS